MKYYLRIYPIVGYFPIHHSYLNTVLSDIRIDSWYLCNSQAIQFKPHVTRLLSSIFQTQKILSLEVDFFMPLFFAMLSEFIHVQYKKLYCIPSRTIIAFDAWSGEHQLVTSVQDTPDWQVTLFLHEDFKLLWRHFQ